MNLRYKKTFIGIVLFICVSIINGCIPELTDETPLALVNGEPVTYGEFKHELQGFHLQREEKKGIGPMDIQSFLDKLIRKRLFIQEGIRTGLLNRPDVKQALDSELKKQAVLILHREEIGDKVNVTDEAAWGEYCSLLNKRMDNFKKIREGFSIDPNNRSKKVKNYIMMLRRRARLEVDPNFVWHSKESCDPNKIVARVNGKGITYNDLSTAINESEGKKDWKFALQWLIDQDLLEEERERFVPTEDSFEKAKTNVKKNLIKEERKKMEDSYLKELREKAKISKDISDPNILLDEARDPNNPVAWINDEPITLADLRSNIKIEDIEDSPSEDIRAKMDDRLQYIIDCRLLDKEALSRGYGELPEVKKAIEKVKDRIIYDKFFRELLIPSIKIKDDEVETYYQEHMDLFRTPVYVKIDEIRLNTEEEADQIRSELEAGADFTFLTKRSMMQRITSMHWISVKQISNDIMEGLIQTEEGDWLGPVSWEKGYSIFLLKRRRGGEQIPFDMAKKDAKNSLWKERYDQAVKKWEDILRSSSEIIIYEDRLQAILSSAEGKGDVDKK